MKRYLVGLLLLLLFLISHLLVIAQRKSVELADIEDKLIRSVDEDFPTWSRQEISPIQSSGDIIINQWRHDRQVIRITIIRYASPEQSHERIQEFANDMKAKRKVAEEGDEEYSLGSGNNSVFLRKGVFVVDVEIAAEANDEKELLKSFTRLAVKVVK
jgi:hypothetical protein